MTRHNEAYLNELISDAAYEAVRQSPLFDKCENHIVDLKADELSERVKKVIGEWIDEETRETFPVTSPAVKSLSEAQSERDAQAA